MVLMTEASPPQAPDSSASTVTQNTGPFQLLDTHTRATKWGQGGFFTVGRGSLANCFEAGSRHRRASAVAAHKGKKGQKGGEDTKGFVGSQTGVKCIPNVTPVCMSEVRRGSPTSLRVTAGARQIIICHVSHQSSHLISH